MESTFPLVIFSNASSRFKNADAVVVIGANGVLKPGYAGVENPLYSREKGVYPELGDAKETLMRLMTGIA